MIKFSELIYNIQIKNKTYSERFVISGLVQVFSIKNDFKSYFSQDNVDYCKILISLETLFELTLNNLD